MVAAAAPTLNRKEFVADQEVRCLQDLWAALAPATPLPPELATAGRACSPRLGELSICG